MTKYLGESFTIKGIFKYSDGELFDPDTHLIILKNPKDTTINTSTTPNKISTGVYRTTIKIPVNGMLGIWCLWWAVIKNGEMDMEPYRFKVKHTPI